MRLLENICRLLTTKKRIILSIDLGYLMKDCLQIGTVSNQALIKMTGKAGMLVLLADLNFQEITVSAGRVPACTSFTVWS